MFSRLKNQLASSLRYKLLVLVLLPILLIAPLTVGFVSHWSQGYGHDQLLRRASSGLVVTHDIFRRMQNDFLGELESVAASYSFLTAFSHRDASRIVNQLAAIRDSTGFDFLHVTDLKGRWLYGPDSVHGGGIAEHSPLQQQAIRRGTPQVGIEIYQPADLQQYHPSLVSSITIEPIDTSSARDSGRTPEASAMVVRAIAPVRDLQGTVVAMLDGGVVLNKKFAVVDEIRDLVYGPDNLPEGSIGTVTIFLDDVRISTNVPMSNGKRALGTRVSKEVHNSVLVGGNTWVDRDFVVSDWYLAAYEPIVDVYGKRVGILNTGFIEAPFRTAYNKTLGFSLLVVLFGSLVVAAVVVRGAESIFQRIDAIVDVVRALRAGEDRRVGYTGAKDEVAELASQFDETLDLLTLKNQQIHQAAEVLEHRVDERTRELKEKNMRLEETVELLKETREQLVSAEKLAALGELTAGVAHEINNPIAVIQGNMELLRAELGEDGAIVEEETSLILDQVERIQSLVERLLLYSRPSSYGSNLSDLDVNEVVRDTLALVRHEFAQKSIEVETQLLAEVSVKFNYQALQQVLVNLLINAVHASDTDGVVYVRTAEWKDQGVVIEVQDEGVGIAKDELRRVFDPFFTTKKAGGTGLGLAISQRAIRRHGGDICVHSELGLGAKFQVYIYSEPRVVDELSVEPSGELSGAYEYEEAHAPITIAGGGST